VIDELRQSLPDTPSGIPTQWTQDNLHGHGPSAYRSFAQRSAPATARGYACLKGLLLGLLLIRDRNQAACNLRIIDEVTRFVRMASADVHVEHEPARARFLSSLPEIFKPSEVLRAIADERRS